jgi:hypothetical protein
MYSADSFICLLPVSVSPLAKSYLPIVGGGRVSQPCSAKREREAANLVSVASAGGEQQSVATPQAARGWARPPADHTPRTNLASASALLSRRLQAPLALREPQGGAVEGPCDSLHAWVALDAIRKLQRALAMPHLRIPH